MKYMLLCYDDPKLWERAGEAALREAMQEAVELTHELHARGEYLFASPLEPVDRATSIRVRDGKRIVTDGPFAETREFLGGFYLIDVPDLDAAIRVAERHPGARSGTVEIRPVFVLEGLPAARLTEESPHAERPPSGRAAGENPFERGESHVEEDRDRRRRPGRDGRSGAGRIR